MSDDLVGFERPDNVVTLRDAAARDSSGHDAATRPPANPSAITASASAVDFGRQAGSSSRPLKAAHGDGVWHPPPPGSVVSPSGADAAECFRQQRADVRASF
jgi:hypothetical protein